jgi:hypothetical protein
MFREQNATLVILFLMLWFCQDLFALGKASGSQILDTASVTTPLITAEITLTNAKLHGTTEIGDITAHIAQNGLGDLVFTDGNTGTKTLAELAAGGGTNYWTKTGDVIKNNNSGTVEIGNLGFADPGPDASMFGRGAYLDGGTGSVIIMGTDSVNIVSQSDPALGLGPNSLQLDNTTGFGIGIGSTNNFSVWRDYTQCGASLKVGGTIECLQTVEAQAFTIGGVPIGGGTVPQTVEVWNAVGDTKDYVLGEELIGGPHIEYDMATTQKPYTDYTWTTSGEVTTVHFTQTPEVLYIGFTYNYQP